MVSTPARNSACSIRVRPERATRSATPPRLSASTSRSAAVRAAPSRHSHHGSSGSSKPATLRMPSASAKRASNTGLTRPPKETACGSPSGARSSWRPIQPVGSTSTSGRPKNHAFSASKCESELPASPAPSTTRETALVVELLQPGQARMEREPGAAHGVVVQPEPRARRPEPPGRGAAARSASAAGHRRRRAGRSCSRGRCRRRGSPAPARGSRRPRPRTRGSPDRARGRWTAPPWRRCPSGSGVSRCASRLLVHLELGQREQQHEQPAVLRLEPERAPELAFRDVVDRALARRRRDLEPEPRDRVVDERLRRGAEWQLQLEAEAVLAERPLASACASSIRAR